MIASTSTISLKPNAAIRFANESHAKLSLKLAIGVYMIRLVIFVRLRISPLISVVKVARLGTPVTSAATSAMISTVYVTFTGTVRLTLYPSMYSKKSRYSLSCLS